MGTTFRHAETCHLLQGSDTRSNDKMHNASQIRSTYKQSPWIPQWANDFASCAPHGIPILAPPRQPLTAIGVGSSKRPVPPEARRDSILHFYMDDVELNRLYCKPSKVLNLASQHRAVITPDFSLLLGMPEHQRIRSVVQSREIGAYLQAHGIDVIPNIRWSSRLDLDFVLDGLPLGGSLAISTQGIIRNRTLRTILLCGIPVVLERMKPTSVLIYGSNAFGIKEAFPNDLHVLHFQSDLSAVHSKMGT